MKCDRLFYKKEVKEYYAFKLSITVDKKEGNSVTQTGGGSYLTNFFDFYTDDNQETKGTMSWRQCDQCFAKGYFYSLSIRNIILP